MSEKTQKITSRVIAYDAAMPYVGIGYAYPTSEIGGAHGGYYTYKTAGGSAVSVHYGDLYPTIEFAAHVVAGLLAYTHAKRDRYCLGGDLRATLLGTGNHHTVTAK